jgi:hypothetical protein
VSITPEQLAQAMNEIYVAQMRAEGFATENMIDRFCLWERLDDRERGHRVKIATVFLDRFTVVEKLPVHGEDS